MSRTRPHDEFLELCAVSTSGQLTEEEQRKLDEHLAVCMSCRETLKQYQAVVDQVVPAAAAERTPDNLDAGPNWSLERAEGALFERIDREQKQTETHPHGESPFGVSRAAAFQLSSEVTWRNIWMLYAVGIILFITLGIVVYEVGVQRGARSARNTPSVSASENRASIEEQLSDVSHEREMARTQIEQRDRLIADLRQQLERQSAEIAHLKTAQVKLESDFDRGEAERGKLAQERSDLALKLASAQSSAQAMQQKLDSLTQQSSHDAARMTGLEAKVNDLTRLLQEREATIDQQVELLARDRDIRELMGARDLYLAEVHDVARTGATNKPYGRVFYTKGKSLIFYAYDLDQQKAVKSASTFQAWGRRGTDWQQAVPLGIFYEDNATKRRWVLKLDDPKVLAQIDAVFVTVEPNGGSLKPSDKPLLFAYLRVEPNHP